MQRRDGDLREERSGVADSDLIILIGNEARECGQVQKVQKKQTSGVLEEIQLEDIAVCPDTVDVAMQFILLKSSWEMFKPPVNLTDC